MKLTQTTFLVLSTLSWFGLSTSINPAADELSELMAANKLEDKELRIDTNGDIYMGSGLAEVYNAKQIATANTTEGGDTKRASSGGGGGSGVIFQYRLKGCNGINSGMYDSDGVPILYTTGTCVQAGCKCTARGTIYNCGYPASLYCSTNMGAQCYCWLGIN